MGQTASMTQRPVLVAIALAVASGSASADVLKLFAEAHGGGAYGSGVAGDLKDASFFGQAKGPAYGLLIGGKVLFVNAWLQHHQFSGGDGLRTWTQFGVGSRGSIDIGDSESGLYVELGAGLWYGMGTGAQVKPPLDRSQVTDRGIIGEARVGVGKHLSSIFDLGVIVPVSYGYFLRSSAGGLSDLSTHYIGFQAEGLIALRANIIAL